MIVFEPAASDLLTAKEIADATGIHRQQVARMLSRTPAAEKGRRGKGGAARWRRDAVVKEIWRRYEAAGARAEMWKRRAWKARDC